MPTSPACEAVITSAIAQIERRYLVEWTPWADVVFEARLLGWTENDSAADFVEISEFTQARSFPTFDRALEFAREVCPVDTWACPLIRRQELVTHDTDDLGRRVHPMRSWETDASWECAANDQPDELHPSTEF